MSDTEFTGNDSGDAMDEKELMDIFNGLDDDLINRQIDELLAEKGEYVDMDNIKEKSFNKLEKGKKKRGIGKRVAIVAAVAALTVSTVYAKDIQRALQSFFGKSTVYQTVVDGDAYYLPEKLALGDKYTLRNATMSEARLELSIESTEKMSDDWYESLNLTVSESGGGKNYEGGGYTYYDGALFVMFYQMPTLVSFDISINGEVYPVSLTKADSLAVDESLVIGVSQREQPVPEVQGEAPKAEALPLIANVAASRNDEGVGVGINIAVGFEDRGLKLSLLGAEAEDDAKEYTHTFENNETGTIGSSTGPHPKPLMAYDAENNAYELKKPANAVGRPVTVFETDAAPGTPLTLKVPAIQVHYEKEVDRITLPIPESGEVELGEEIDFIIQKAVIKTIKRTSETTAEVTFDINTGADKSVKIRDMFAYSSDVIKGNTVLSGNTAVLTLTFENGTKEAEVDFSWPSFVIEGDWTIELK